MKKIALFAILFIGILFFIKPEAVNAGGCLTPPSDTGRVTLSVDLQGGTYKVWSRMKAANSTNNSFYIEIDKCAYLVGDSPEISSSEWTWVDYTGGNITNKLTVTLPPGSHVITLIGNEDGVGVDRLLMTQNLTCIPTGTSGDNCPAETTDVNQPVISQISAYDITATSAKVTWTLNEYASGQVEYRPSGTNTWQQTNIQTCCTYNYHIQTLSNLTNGTTYEYRVKSIDASSNQSISGICSFTAGGTTPVACSASAPSATPTPTPSKAPTSTPTPTSAPTDTTPPVISNPRVEEVTATTAKFKWDLDEPASGQVEYRASGVSTWTKTGIQTCCSYDYHIQSVTGLTNGTIYEYQITSVDAAGNEKVSSICRFTAGGSATQACNTSPATFRIVGKHVGANGAPLTLAGQKVTITNTSTNNSLTSSGSPNWTFDALPIGSYQITTSPISGYTIEHMVCYDCVDTDNYFSNNTFTLSETDSEYVGITFKYTPVATVTTSPSSTPVPTPLPTDTVLRFQSVKLHGIGKGGDNINPNSTGTQNPLRTTRQLYIELIDSSGNTLPSVSGNITYRGNTYGDFTGDIALSNSVSTGSYLIKIKSPQYLKKQVIGIITVTKGIITNIPSISLITGDIDNNNALTLSDYNILTDCYSDLLPAKNCSDAAKKSSADISDDGAVNANDYNLFLRELSVVSGD